MQNLKKIKLQKHFASDNNSGVLPEVMQALNAVNREHVASYGADPFTELANQEIHRLFGACDIYYVFNGTAANVLAIQSLLKPYEAVICSDISHLHNDECAAPEANIGTKLLLCPHYNGKMQVSDIKKHLKRRGDTHHVQPKVISITQPTEYGTCYTYLELKKICDFAKSNDLLLHMDGSRLVNASYYLKKTLKALTNDLGFDVVSFGGTKNGLLGGEAILSFVKDNQDPLRYIRKQNMQLAGKMRFISSQFYAWLKNDTYVQVAKHSHEMALYLKKKLEKIKTIEITQEVESNAVFIKLPKTLYKKLKKHYFFYIWDSQTWEARLMTTFDTNKDDIDKFIGLIKELSN